MTTTVPEKNEVPETIPAEPKISAVRDELKADPERLAELIAALADYERTVTVAELRDDESDPSVLRAFAALCEVLAESRKQDLRIKSGSTWEIVRSATDVELTETVVRSVWSKRYQAWRNGRQS